MSIHIHAPAPTGRRIVHQHCPTCGRLSYMLVWSFEWYGPHVVCTRCGESWNDGSREPRPFARGWRKRAVAHAKWCWRRERRSGGGA